MYLLQNDYHNKISEHIHHLITFFVVRVFKICSLSNLQVYNTVLFTVIAMPYIRSPERTHLIIGSLYT